MQIPKLFNKVFALLCVMLVLGISLLLYISINFSEKNQVTGIVTFSKSGTGFFQPRCEITALFIVKGKTYQLRQNRFMFSNRICPSAGQKITIFYNPVNLKYASTFIIKKTYFHFMGLLLGLIVIALLISLIKIFKK